MTSKPSDFGVEDLDQDQSFKPVNDSSIAPPDPQTIVIQSGPAVENIATGKSEGAPKGVQKEVTEEKTSSVAHGKRMILN